jgi:hypothetical protein
MAYDEKLADRIRKAFGTHALGRSPACAFATRKRCTNPNIPDRAPTLAHLSKHSRTEALELSPAPVVGAFRILPARNSVSGSLNQVR